MRPERSKRANRAGQPWPRRAETADAQGGDGASLDEDEIAQRVRRHDVGRRHAVQMGAFLMALRVRGETIREITGAARLMRERMTLVEAPPGAVDIVGTGGDGHGTYNVSTCAALVAAGAGVPVAKHGNRSVSSLSGASDVLSASALRSTSARCHLARHR